MQIDQEIKIWIHTNRNKLDQESTYCNFEDYESISHLPATIEEAVLD